MNDLNQLVNAIRTQDDFVVFVHTLLNDLRKNPDQWENVTLEHYLNAVATWSEGMEGYFMNTNQTMPKDVNWRIIGQILLAAKFYE